jgi:four helix bundle protein
MAIKDYRELLVWQKAMDLVEQIYRITAHFPREEIYGLTGQLRRAAVSVPSNIAEGHGRRSPRELLKFLAIANGSLKEAETQLFIAQRLGYIDEPTRAGVFWLAAEIGRLAYGLANSVRRRLDPPKPST